MSNLITTTALERVEMERHGTVRAAGDLLCRDLGIPRETVRAHVVALLLDSCLKQERWSRGQGDG